MGQVLGLNLFSTAPAAAQEEGSAGTVQTFDGPSHSTARRTAVPRPPAAGQPAMSVPGSFASERPPTLASQEGAVAADDGENVTADLEAQEVQLT